MMEFTPCYYDKFKCIADKCTHNCCIGWEIDIDPDTLDMYCALDGDIGDRLRSNIACSGDSPHFVLGEGERCPFLNEHGLCDIITALGDEGICNICADHPRFRNFYDNFTELGLGLCCEEASRVVLNCTEPFTVKCATDEDAPLTDDERAVYDFRNHLFDILQSRGRDFLDVISDVSFRADMDITLISLDKLCDAYLSLERLDDKWGEMLTNLMGYEFDFGVFHDDNFRIPFEQLACYFLYRHIPDAVVCGGLASRIRFAVVSTVLIGALFQKGADHSMEALSDIARMYSAEVEYSDDNMTKILDTLSEDIIYG